MFGAVWSEEIVAGRPAWLFRKVPGGTFLMGLSDPELDAVRAIERGGGVEDTVEPFFAGAGDALPVRQVRVEPFLIARHPLTVAQVRHWLPDYQDDYTDKDSGTARIEDARSRRSRSGSASVVSGSRAPCIARVVGEPTGVPLRR